MPTSSLADQPPASFLSSHSEIVPLPVDSSRKIKLPDLFSPVPGTVSGGFGWGLGGCEAGF